MRSERSTTMYGMRVTDKGLGARAGLLALALFIGAGLAAGPVSAQDKDKKPAAAKPAAPAKPAAAAAAAPVAKGEDAKDQSAWVKLCEKAPNITDPKKELNVCLTHHERL